MLDTSSRMWHALGAALLWRSMPVAYNEILEDFSHYGFDLRGSLSMFDRSERGVRIVIVFGSFLFFRALQYVVRWYLFGKCTFRAFSYFGISGRNRNHDSSRDLTVISGLWAAYALLFYQRLFDDLVNYRCQVAVDLIYVSFGYLLHDFFDLILNEQSARIIELLFHHVVVITGFVVTLVTEKYLGIVIFGLLMELNSIFLHTRSLMNLWVIQLVRRKN
ncbi:unnamed protein product [Cylicostephanus goldi]|uniref:TLC domain-containing protein n=1 Tax=Cylicostephanus goldi TaxID=71465 RepID=A0A3P6SFB9_CYLGO|nr:unnamed protein product [Cylicostephanus goldi]